MSNIDSYVVMWYRSAKVNLNTMLGSGVKIGFMDKWHQQELKIYKVIQKTLIGDELVTRETKRRLVNNIIRNPIKSRYSTVYFV